LPQWSFGRVTLMGDAAHPMLPWGSSGATLSFVDAYALADSLSQHHAIEDGLRAYEAMQRPITNRVIEENRRAGPVDFMTIIEERAPNGFKNIEELMSRDELTALVMRYKPVAAFDRETVNKPIDLRLRPTA
jgi:2-polyprenyl-6-methoxyphenol hydroxylase-like FAD-dependent oxidoreductase